MSTFLQPKMWRQVGPLLVGVLVLACAGCQTLAPTREQQVQASDWQKGDLNPELAGPAVFLGNLLSAFLPFAKP